MYLFAAHQTIEEIWETGGRRPVPESGREGNTHGYVSCRLKLLQGLGRTPLKQTIRGYNGLTSLQVILNSSCCYCVLRNDTEQRCNVLLQLFNNARADYDWGKPALFVMVETYLNTDNDLGWEEASLEGCTGPSEEAIKIAQKLLSESRQASD